MKGTHFTPSKERAGIWFQHRGHEVCEALDRRVHTSSGHMMRSPFNPDLANYPPCPPCVYIQRELTQMNDHKSHSFSKYDNREMNMRDAELLFGLGGRANRTMGRKMADESKDQTRSEGDFLTHYGRRVVRCDYNTVNTDVYRGCQPCEADRAPRLYGAFPKEYQEPVEGRRSWSQRCVPPVDPTQSDEKASLETLALSQVPFAKGTKAWKYSYKPITKMIPGCDRISLSNPYPGVCVRPESLYSSSCDVNI